MQAAGSSLLAKIAHFLVLDALKMAGLTKFSSVQIFPLATGMTMTCAFLACAAIRQEPSKARHALCFYCITTTIRASAHLQCTALLMPCHLLASLACLHLNEYRRTGNYSETAKFETLLFQRVLGTTNMKECVIFWVQGTLKSVLSCELVAAAGYVGCCK